MVGVHSETCSSTGHYASGRVSLKPLKPTQNNVVSISTCSAPCKLWVIIQHGVKPEIAINILAEIEAVSLGSAPCVRIHASR